MRVLLVLLALMGLAACTDRSFTPETPEALEVGTPFTVFAASTRERKGDGSYGFERSTDINRLELTVSIPPTHTAGQLKFAYSRPDPKTQFTIAERRPFDTKEGFHSRLKSVLRALPPQEREITVFVHGYNATQAETAMRAAQLANDIGLPGALVIYSWPSRGEVLGYAYDIDSMLFARDGLEQLLNDLDGLGANNVVLVAHSMGSLLSMETLRQADIRNPGWAARTLGAVLLLSPDVDVEVFRSQIQNLSPAPDPFLVMISEKDKILNLSARLRGTADRDRLGNLKHVDKVADLPIEVIDATAFSDSAASSHFVAATSPALLTILRDTRQATQVFGSEKLAIEQLLPPQSTQPASASNEIALVPPSNPPS